MTVVVRESAPGGGAGAEARGLLLAARRLLARALGPLPQQGAEAWLASYLASARQARNLTLEHARLCESRERPLAELVEIPRPRPVVSTTEHAVLLEQLEGLIAQARRVAPEDTAAIADLSYETLLCEGKMSAHLRGSAER
jgi:hypothetical protein